MSANSSRRHLRAVTAVDALGAPSAAPAATESADPILSLYQQWLAANAHCRAMSRLDGPHIGKPGCQEHEDGFSDAVDARERIGDRIAEIRATTLAGLIAKLAVAVFLVRESHVRDTEFALEDRLAISALADAQTLLETGGTP